MKQVILLFTSLSLYLVSFSQEVIFKSSQQFTAEQRSSFYASVNIENDLVLFNAPDFKLYAYDRISGKEQWVYRLGWKSDIPPFFAGGLIWATSGDRKVIALDPQTGTVLKSLDAASIESQPFLRNGILYFTGLYDGGHIIAYDMKGDSIKWKRFLAHGISVTPYYLADKIIANVEGDHWLEFSYDGSLASRDCETEEGVFPSESPCAKQFNLRTHDGQELKGKKATALGLEENTVPENTLTGESTFILHDGQLHVVGRKTKKKFSITLRSLSDSIPGDLDSPSRILKVDEENIYLLYSDHFIHYNYRNKKLVKVVSLEQLAPHQVVMDSEKLWMVSKADGLLYAVTI